MNAPLKHIIYKRLGITKELRQLLQTNNEFARLNREHTQKKIDDEFLFIKENGISEVEFQVVGSPEELIIYVRKGNDPNIGPMNLAR